MVTRSQPEVGQPHAAVPGGDELVARDARFTVGVEEIEYFPRNGAALGVVDVRVGVVVEAVEPLDVAGGPV